MTNNTLPKCKIIIADDDDDSRKLLCFLLESEGWHVLEARDGKEAIEKVVEENPDILILDNRMPEFTGQEVYQHLREKGIPITVILMTAFSDIQQLAASLDIPYFFQKPIDFAELLATIESISADRG